MRAGRKTRIACASSLLSRPTISTASAIGPPLTVLRRYCTPSSPRSVARFAICSASFRKRAAIEARRQLLHGGLRHHLQARWSGPRRPDAHAVLLRRIRERAPRFPSFAKRPGDAGTLRFDAGNQFERLLHRGVAAAGGGFLAQAHERRADQSLQFGVLLDVQTQAQMPQRRPEQASDRPWRTTRPSRERPAAVFLRASLSWLSAQAA